MAVLLALAIAALAIIFLNALGLFADRRFALPVAPAFVVFGSCALLGRRCSSSTLRAIEENIPSTSRPAVPASK